MITLSNKEILNELREIGVDTNTDLFLYLILYKSYFSVNYCRTLKQIKGLKKLVYNCLKKCNRLNIRCSYSTEI